jgi:hypothetical protein
MKHALLDEVWRVRDELGAQCGYNVKQLAVLVRGEEAKADKRLVREPKPRARHRQGASPG